MDLLIYLGGGAGALLALGTLIRGAWRINRRIVGIAAAVVELPRITGQWSLLQS
jgi:hypothetical protein